MSVSTLPMQQEVLQRLAVFYEMLANPGAYAELLEDVKSTLAGMNETISAYTTVQEAQTYLASAQATLVQAQQEAQALKEAAQKETAAVKAAQAARTLELEAKEEALVKLGAETRALDKTVRDRQQELEKAISAVTARELAVKKREETLATDEAALREKVAAAAKLVGV